MIGTLFSSLCISSKDLIYIYIYLVHELWPLLFLFRIGERAVPKGMEDVPKSNGECGKIIFQSDRENPLEPTAD